MIDSKQLSKQIWLEATEGKVGADIAGARGIFAERLWHRAVKYRKKVYLKELTDSKEKGKETEERELQMEFTFTRQFAKVNLTDLDLDVGVYCLPLYSGRGE